MPISHNDIYNVSNWISEQVSNAGLINAVVGISGGIDSAVVASLCVEALGKEKVLGVILPIHSSVVSGSLGMQLIENLGIDHIVMDHTTAFDRWHTDFMENKDLAKFFMSGAIKKDDQSLRMMKGNSMARMRMMDLYAIAYLCKGLVVGTTNKTEGSIGYMTKHGDAAVDIEPILDYSKTEVYELADKLPGIPKEIKVRKPTAELWDGQTDEDEIGMSYEYLDKVLTRIRNDSGSSVRLQGFEEDSILKVREMILNNLHKSMLPPAYRRGGRQ